MEFVGVIDDYMLQNSVMLLRRQDEFALLVRHSFNCLGDDINFVVGH